MDNLFCPSHMLIDAKETPRAVLFNKTIVDKLAKADRKQSQDDGTVTYGNLPVSDNLFSLHLNVFIL